MARLAFCGLGRMGAGMAGCLLRGGHEVRLWNRSPAKARELVAMGGILAASPREAAERAEAAFSMVSDSEASREVWLGPNGMLEGLGAQAIAIECSTLSHSWVAELAACVASRGADYLDCPVTGLPDAAASGALTLLVGGQDTVVERAAEYLAPLSKARTHFGPVGAATAYKLIVNLIGAVEIAATAEAMETARRAGLDLGQVAEALAASTAGSFHVGRQARIMAAEAHAQQVAFTTDLRRKDSRYALALSHDLGVASDLGDSALARFDHASNMGFGDQNESHVLDAVRDKSRPSRR